MSDYKPCNSAHAVEQAVVGVRIAKPIQDALFQNVVAEADRLANVYNLPGKMQLDPMALMMGKQVISLGYHNDMLMAPGMLYCRIAPDGTTEEELTIERGAITYRTHKYERWIDVSTKIENFLLPLVEKITEGQPSRVSVIELRCIDRFIAKNESDPSLSSAIRDDSAFVARNLLDKNDMLHQHIGWFENETPQKRRLINLNLSVTSVNGNKELVILQVISDQGDLGNILSDTDHLNPSLLEKFNTLHRKDKEILKQILTDDLQKEINLNCG